jgi:hypothetical protein
MLRSKSRCALDCLDLKGCNRSVAGSTPCLRLGIVHVHSVTGKVFKMG